MRILLIEDDLDDIELLNDALQSNNVHYKMDNIHDGSTAINHINENPVPPDIIILDLNLPKAHGKDVIRAIKSNPHFKNTPLLILTTSSAKEDMEYAYKYGANKYIIKPTTLNEITQVITTIKELVIKPA